MTSVVLTLIEDRHITASLVFKTLWYFITVRNAVCFFCQMAIRCISEIVVCFRRFQVGRIYKNVSGELLAAFLGIQRSVRDQSFDFYGGGQEDVFRPGNFFICIFCHWHCHKNYNR